MLAFSKSNLYIKNSISTSQNTLMKKEGQINRSIIEQERVESTVLKKYKSIADYVAKEATKEDFDEGKPTSSLDKLHMISTLQKDHHAAYLYQGLTDNGYSIKHYDSGHPWVVYWTIHGLNLLNDSEYHIGSPKLKNQLVKFLSYCQHPSGGFSGSPGQIAHVASTYAAVLSLVEIGTPEALSLIDRKGMYDFFIRMRDSRNKGSFHMHEIGDEDMRCVYIVVVIAKLLNILTD